MFNSHSPVASPAAIAVTPAHSSSSRLWTWFMLGFAIGALFLFAPGTAHAGGASEIGETFAGKVTDDPTEAKEIGNAFEALIETLPESREVARELSGGKRTIRPARGVSGPFQELVVNFDKVACAAWIVSYRDWMLGLMLAKDPETPPETLAAAQNLLNKVIYGCRKIMDPESYQAGANAVGGGGAATTPAEEPRRATRVEIIDGELMISVSDNICWNMCRDKWLAWKGAQGMRQRAEDSIRDKRLTADVLEKDTIPWLERRLASAERQLNSLKARQPKYPKSDPAINGRVAQTEADIANLRTEIAAKKAQVATLRAEATALEQTVPGLLQQEQAALKAYLDCLKSCKSMADNAKDSSTWVDKTIPKLQLRLDALDRRLAPPPRPATDRRTSMAPRYVPESQEVLVARANAIAALRTGEVTNSGTQVMPALNGYFREDNDQARRDARNAMEDARHGEFGQGGGMNEIVPSSQPIAVETPLSEASYPAEVPQSSVPHYHGDEECFDQH